MPRSKRPIPQLSIFARFITQVKNKGRYTDTTLAKRLGVRREHVNLMRHDKVAHSQAITRKLMRISAALSVRTPKEIGSL